MSIDDGWVWRVGFCYRQCLACSGGLHGLTETAKAAWVAGSDRTSGYDIAQVLWMAEA